MSGAPLSRNSRERSELYAAADGPEELAEQQRRAVVLLDQAQ